MTRSDSGSVPHCSFCAKSKDEVRVLVAGLDGMICDECVELVADVIRQRAERTPSPAAVDENAAAGAAGRQRAHSYESQSSGALGALLARRHSILVRLANDIREIAALLRERGLDDAVIGDAAGVDEDDVIGEFLGRVLKIPRLTVASTSDAPRGCTCDWLERASKDPDLPVEFDPKTCEFEFLHYPKGRGGMPPARLLLRHCPMCGGRAPRSTRPALFKPISREEARRLNSLLADVKSIDDAVAKFGSPDHDLPEGVSISTPEKDGRPPTSKSYRLVIFTRLSDTIDVWLTDYHRERVDIQLLGKSLSEGSDGTV